RTSPSQGEDTGSNPVGTATRQIENERGGRIPGERWIIAFVSYDWQMGWVPPKIEDVAQEMAKCLVEGDEASARRLAFRFVEHVDKPITNYRTEMVAARFTTTGSKRFDALLAGLAELSCATHHDVAPNWVNDEELFLNELWFVSEMPLLHGEALAHSPISLARRGVFVTQGSLTYA
ncbi:MAG: hypothetical protein WCI12_04000, partial [Actinomycetes bacterium]